MFTRKYDTCFFERYAQISLATLLGHEFDCLVNLDRPDLQSEDGKSIGIEVTRAMEESRAAEQELLKDMAGITQGRSDLEIDQILQYGYSFGLGAGRFIGAKELLYWKMALPMKRIIQSKVDKAGSGFYGQWNKLGLYVFSKDDLEERDAIKIMHYTIGLQKYQSIKYNRLYLADVNDLFVCNLDDGLQESYRMLRYLISQEQRETFYREAVS
ncbi:MAG: hypothetical protein IJS70_01395 [Bacteroidales bacterium]|nr:hypothetical protein [Bacteroidales bacterium]MBQ7457804.1 hypothetical protein [Bacteroidales bacterium]MBQ9529715.1 hypothetical protein [Bacteroidales bacterium]